MRDLANEIPDVDLLLELQPEELAGKLLFVLRRRLEQPNTRSVHLGNCLNEVGGNFGNDAPYPIARQDEVKIAITEAWHYLVAQGMIMPSSDGNGTNGWSVLSRRAKRFETEAEFAQHRAARLLPKEILHMRFADIVWASFVRGEFDAAVFQAMKAVEVFVREAAGLDNGSLGIQLMTEAFKPVGGILTDQTAEGSEKNARLQLFCGAIGSYKNPNSHRDVNMEDPIEAVEVILLANHLMKIVDARIAARNGAV